MGSGPPLLLETGVSAVGVEAALEAATTSIGFYFGLAEGLRTAAAGSG